MNTIIRNTGNASLIDDQFTFLAFSNNIIPIINENDTVAVDEIKIGDNDRLAARVAQMISADVMILFSDIDGLYDKNPKVEKDAKLISEVANINSKRCENRSFTRFSAESDVDVKLLRTIQPHNMIALLAGQRRQFVFFLKRTGSWHFDTAESAFRSET